MAPTVQGPCQILQCCWRQTFKGASKLQNCFWQGILHESPCVLLLPV